MNKQFDYLQRYREFVDDTESDKRFHLFCALSAVSVMLGRKVYFDFGHNNLHPNMYILLCGVPSARKSSAIAIAADLVRGTGFTKFCPEKSSREKFLSDFSRGFDSMNLFKEAAISKILDTPVNMKPSIADLSNWIIQPEALVTSDVYMAISEFCDFIGQNNINFATTLTNLYDNLPNYSERFKNSQSVNIIRPCVNILGALTPEHFVTHVPPELMGQGFMSRTILVFGSAPQRKIAFPKKADPQKRAQLVFHLEAVAKLRGEMVFTPDARRAVTEIYEQYYPIPDARFQYYTGRRHTHLIKLCMVVAGLQLRTKMTLEDVINANTLLVGIEAFMPDALGEYGDGKFATAAQKVLEVLKDKPNHVMDLEEIYTSIRQNINTIRDLHDVINNLSAAKKITVNNKAVMLNSAANSKNTIYVDIPKYFPEIRAYSKELSI